MLRAVPLVRIAAGMALVWGLGEGFASMPTHAASAPAAPVAPKPIPKRALSFTLDNDSVTGTIPFGEELSLGVLLTGGTPTTDQLVATVEGVSIDKVMVPMEPTDNPVQWKATIALKPRPLGYTSVRPKALRVRVTVSQVKQSGLVKLIGRSAYITMAHDRPEPPPSSPPAANDNESADPDVELVATAQSSGDEVQPDVAPVANALISEEDLKPLPEARGEQAYWKEIARLISRSWGQRVRYAKGVPVARETVRVRFQMHPNGEAQLIQIERTSGVRDVDEAGLLAIVHAHPFPSFREAIGDDVVDVHVRMRTGARPSAVVQESLATGTPGGGPVPNTSPKATTDSK